MMVYLNSLKPSEVLVQDYILLFPMWRKVKVVCNAIFIRHFSGIFHARCFLNFSICNVFSYSSDVFGL